MSVFDKLNLSPKQISPEATFDQLLTAIDCPN